MERRDLLLVKSRARIQGALIQSDLKQEEAV